mmetsp:Transcript_36611/g.77841  ORF Transcript_36611/g.77841 Transcript_36611/m.77841 type:complete len:231 (+) Transcript_36611:129-821(+)
MTTTISPEFKNFCVRAGTTCSAFFFLSPIVQMIEVHRSGGQSLNTVNPQTLILMFFNCALWSTWGLFLPMWPAVPGNMLGLFVSIFYLTYCWVMVTRVGSGSAIWSIYKAYATVMAFCTSLCFALGAAVSHDVAVGTGNLAMIICICMYASPLSVLGQVLRERSSELLPPLQCWMQFFNCFFWTFVGYSEWSFPMLACNILGLLLATVQLGCLAAFPSSKTAKNDHRESA